MQGAYKCVLLRTHDLMLTSAERALFAVEVKTRTIMVINQSFGVGTVGCSVNLNVPYIHIGTQCLICSLTSLLPHLLLHVSLSQQCPVYCSAGCNSCAAALTRRWHASHIRRFYLHWSLHDLFDITSSVVVARLTQRIPVHSCPLPGNAREKHQWRYYHEWSTGDVRCMDRTVCIKWPEMGRIYGAQYD